MRIRSGRAPAMFAARLVGFAAAALLYSSVPAISQSGNKSAGAGSQSLAGAWTFRLDPTGVGVSERWYESPLPDHVRLPGSLDENRKGAPNTRKPNYDHLSRLYEYTGAAWYQREVEIPETWRGKRITLFLERCHWESRAWIDGTPLGMQDSLCVPHVYEFGEAVKPGRHTLTLRVDNTLKYNVGTAAHSVTEETQTDWNGVIGRMELRASDPVRIETLEVVPIPARHRAIVSLDVGNATGKPMRCSLLLTAEGRDGQRLARRPAPVRLAFTARPGGSTITPAISMGANALLWDEFHPALYRLKAVLTAANAGKPFTDTRETTFGMRDLRVKDKQFVVNGRTIFLRGTLECCIFPLTGHPPMDQAAWTRVFGIAKSYGLNHMRFHSWCPPEAAFTAADRAGFLLQIEAPQWVFDVGKDPPRDRFIEQEVLRILSTYGNHPSFGMLCMGNELQGDKSFLKHLVELGQNVDRRHLYTSSTAWSFNDNDDYNVAVIRGLSGPGTEHDFRAADASSRVPIVSHEVGQWTIYPNLAEIPKYTGVLRPRNFERIRDDLAARHMLDQAPAFTLATGKLMALLYKDEIEGLLRTPKHAGFQLLDLHDFPGQGTALVGILDPFWDSKDLITPKEFRGFCGPTVPLLRLKKRVFTQGEMLDTAIEIAHFGEKSLSNVVPKWVLRDSKGGLVTYGVFPISSLPTGRLTPVASISVPLDKVSAPDKLTITVSIDGTEIRNDWSIWVYPPAKDSEAAGDVVIRTTWDDETRNALAQGKKVLLLAGPGMLAKSLGGSFTPVFWSPVWFSSPPGTMSLLCDPKHPALADFPTAMHSDWQWYELLQGSRSIVMDQLPEALRPIVQVIDNFTRNYRLGNLFEAQVGPGRLMVCSLNLRGDPKSRPAAAQMRASLLAYMNSDGFRPSVSLDGSSLEKLFRPPSNAVLSQSAPASLEMARLRVKAAVRVAAPELAEPWKAGVDDVAVRQAGFGYSVDGGTWRDNVGAAWHNSSPLLVRVTCPKGFTGTFYAHFSDWNNLGRTADVEFQGRQVASLEAYNGPGLWVAIPITAKDSADGMLELSAVSTGGPNVMITEIALVP